MRIPALEKNILIYRAIEMVQFLFYAEDLREQLVSSVGRSINEQISPPLKGSKLMAKIFKRIEDEQLITEAESTEIQNLLDHRNAIAHDIQKLTGDIELPRRNYRFSKYLKIKYDYDALDRLKHWHKALELRLSAHYFLSVSFNPLLFEAAEQAYESELIRLKKRIDRQYLARKQKFKGKHTRAKQQK